VAEIAAVAEAELAQDDPWKGLAGFLEQSLAMQASNRALKDLVTRESHRGRERVPVHGNASRRWPPSSSSEPSSPDACVPTSRRPT
jgi:hypothetical protein